MTFKIDKLGFYKMRNGDKCEVVHIYISTCAVRCGSQYYTYGITGISPDAGHYKSNLNIIAPWTEPKTVAVPETVYFNNKTCDIVFASSNQADIKKYSTEKHLEEVYRIPAHEVTINE